MTTLAAGPYLRATTLDAALEALALPGCRVLAGGTDLLADASLSELRSPVLDVSAVPGLAGLTDSPFDGRAALRIGALTTWTQLRGAGLPGWARALAQAGAQIGGIQIQNRGTIGGNLCNASAAADGVPAMLALDGVVELASRAGRRRLPLDQFILGPRRTARRDDELLVALWFAQPHGRSASTFLKLGARRYLVISIAMVAAAIEFAPDGRIDAARIAVGACGPVARRLPPLEARLLGLSGPLTASRVESLIDDRVTSLLSPIDDVRASAAYRIDAVAALIARAVSELSTSELA